MIAKGKVILRILEFFEVASVILSTHVVACAHSRYNAMKLREVRGHFILVA